MCILLFVHYYYIKLQKKMTFPPLWLSLSDSFTENSQWFLLVNHRTFGKHAGSGHYILISGLYIQSIVSLFHFSGFETKSDLSLSDMIHNATLTSYPCMILNSEGFGKDHKIQSSGVKTCSLYSQTSDSDANMHIDQHHIKGGDC